ncbi:hypothetical protein [Arthrobacter psychrochitiniphilus]|uniref:Uncharacterized protein n=1 Tax=Arthrobacter psychrochitiniphilus TaxID=291045 RepID=A0A2V3DTF0_9MICC|nr:hypothetical protein [Arthrobacter psychrochitiniphilus]NYG15857.1 hypothetical protein [Arthrobacter psychrochitiniphilus]PXA66705.1 hypothetical protein CVS29_03745 [Arthrobacter psychrochitiniphilus]
MEPNSNPQSETDLLVQDDLNKLIGTALGVAGDQLEEHGAFLPVGLVLTHEGDLSLVAVSPITTEGGEEEELDADQMVADLFEALSQQKEANRAAAVVCDIHLPDDATDAIHVMAEHSTGVSVSAVRPYRQAPTGWEFGNPFLEAGEVTIWA